MGIEVGGGVGGRVGAFVFLDFLDFLDDLGALGDLAFLLLSWRVALRAGKITFIGTH